MRRPITPFLLLILFSQGLLGRAVPYGYNDEAGGYFDVGNNTRLYYEVLAKGRLCYCCTEGSSATSASSST